MTGGQSWRSRAPRFLGIAALLVAVVPFVALASFAHPQADDFCNANSVRELGFWAAQKHWYVTWTGRFVSTALILADPLAFGSPQNYKLVPLAVFSGLFLALFWLACELLRPTVRASTAGAWALAVFGVYLARMASPAEGIYWYTGVMVYTVPATFAIASVAAAVRSQRASPAGVSWSWAIVSGLFAVLATGGNEIAMLQLGLVFVVLAWLARRAKSARWFLWLVPLALDAIAGAVDVLAPGNFKRADASGGLTHVLGPFVGSGAFSAASLIEWLSSGPVIIAALGIALAGAAASPRLGPESPWRRTSWRWPMLVCLGGVWGAFFFTHWASGFAFRPGPPPRVINAVFLFFLLAGIPTAFMIGVQLLGRIGSLAAQMAPASRWIILVVAVSLFGDGNVRQAYVDLLTRRATTYDAELNQRYDLLRRARQGGQPAIVAPLTRLPQTIYMRDITADPGDWKNACYARFWSVPETRLAP